MTICSSTFPISPFFSTSLLNFNYSLLTKSNSWFPKAMHFSLLIHKFSLVRQSPLKRKHSLLDSYTYLIVVPKAPASKCQRLPSFEAKQANLQIVFHAYTQFSIKYMQNLNPCNIFSRVYWMPWNLCLVVMGLISY